MAHLRTDIERALDELVSQENGMRFQGLAIAIGKKRWPELIARQRKKDNGLDAYAPAGLTPGKIGRGLAASITPTLKKVSGDAEEAKQEFPDLKELLFVTPGKVGNAARKAWETEIRKDHGLELHLIDREEIITLLLMPENATLCASHLYLTSAADSDVVERLERGPFAGLHHKLDILSRELRPPLALVRGYRQLPPEAVARLPTALLVSEYGVVPYDDGRGLRQELLDWATNASSYPSGRLYAGAGGTGKTRLALELVVALNEAGWSAGILPRTALEAETDTGRSASDARLRRFFEARGPNGAALVLDYAEARPREIERVTQAALEAQSGGPIRLILLARRAGDWWQDLLKSSRDVSLVFDERPNVEIATPIGVNQRVEFVFHSVEAFARQLAASQSAEDVLVGSDWMTRRVAMARLGTPEMGIPLSLAIEAFLHARGVAPTQSPLAEMAREERRHWARALRLQPNAPTVLSTRRVHMMHRCAATLTLMQGEGPAADARIDELLDRICDVAFEEPLRAEQAILATRAREYADVRRGIESLYREGGEHGDVLRPIAPDLVGEHVCATLADDLRDVATSAWHALPESRTSILTVLDRASRRVHGTMESNSAYTALLSAIRLTTDVEAEVVVNVAYLSEGRLLESLAEMIEHLPHDDLDRLHHALPRPLGHLVDLSAAVDARRERKAISRVLYEDDDGKFVVFDRPADADDAARRHRDAAFSYIEAGRFDDAVIAARQAVGYARVLHRIEERPGSWIHASCLGALGAALCGTGNGPAG